MKKNIVSTMFSLLILLLVSSSCVVAQDILGAEEAYEYTGCVVTPEDLKKTELLDALKSIDIDCSGKILTILEQVGLHVDCAVATTNGQSGAITMTFKGDSVEALELGFLTTTTVTEIFTENPGLFEIAITAFKGNSTSASSEVVAIKFSGATQSLVIDSPASGGIEANLPVNGTLEAALLDIYIPNATHFGAQVGQGSFDEFYELQTDSTVSFEGPIGADTLTVTFRIGAPQGASAARLPRFSALIDHVDAAPFWQVSCSDMNLVAIPTFINTSRYQLDTSQPIATTQTAPLITAANPATFAITRPVVPTGAPRTRPTVQTKDIVTTKVSDASSLSSSIVFALTMITMATI
jgi:hypothetical protein